MKTNYLMLKELLQEYHPSQRGVLLIDEIDLIRGTLCIGDMDALALRNLRDYVVAHMSRSEKLEDWDRMSAITCCIDHALVDLGEEV